MLIDAWWFRNAQNLKEILQPDCFVPRTHIGLYAELENIVFPLSIRIAAQIQGVTAFENCYVATEPSMLNESCEISVHTDIGLMILRAFADTEILPDQIHVTIQYGENVYMQTIQCEYVTLSGKITDFAGKRFPAAFLLYRVGFGGNSPAMGVWSDENGEYSIVVPKGVYNAFYVDDDSYGKSTLENWSWHMIVDRNEVHDFKVGNGEVYSLCVWSNNGGYSTLFIYFRPMILPSIKANEYQVSINGKHFAVIDICPELNIDDVRVTVNGYEMKNISLQKIYETGNTKAMPAYVLQIQRYAEGYSPLGKQTLVLEYSATHNGGNIIQSQGRTQFQYQDACALSLT